MPVYPGALRVARDTTAIPGHPLLVVSSIACYQKLLTLVANIWEARCRSLQINQTTALAADNYPEMEGLCSWGSKHFGIKPTLTRAS
jgi:hypothetical protein